jgi:hypothetical protein
MNGRIEDNQRGKPEALLAQVLYCRDEAKALKSTLAAYLLAVAALALHEDAADHATALSTGAGTSGG